MAANWFDSAIATVSPRAAARRVLARQAFETLTRGYDGAARGRRTEGWRAPGSSADTEIGVAGALLRDRMRDLVRNNPHAAKAVAVLVNNIIGAGIMPRAASGDDTLDRKVDALFERWTAECDADGQLDFYGLQTLIPAGEGIAFPLGTLDTFTTYGVPANLIETVNTMGLPIYARQIARPDGSAIEVKTEASILPVNKRPRLAVRILSSN